MRWKTVRGGGYGTNTVKWTVELDDGRHAFVKLALDELASRWLRNEWRVYGTLSGGFLPELVAPVIASPRQAIWLVPTARFRDFALTRRGWTTIEGTTDADRARANRLARDDLLTEHVRHTAAKLGFATIDVDGSRALAEIIDEVERHFSPLLPTPA